MASTRSPAAAERPEPPWTRLDSLMLSGVLVLAASFDFYRIGAESLWRDEAMTFHRSSLGLSALVRDSVEHFHVPTYFALMHFVLKLGDTEAWLRGPSAVFGVLAVGACFAYGRLAKDRFTGGVAAILMALSPFQINYAQEARMYSLLVLVTTLGLVGFLWLVKYPALAAIPLVRRDPSARLVVTPAWRSWLLCLLGLLGALSVHNLATMTALALAVVALGALAVDPVHRLGLLKNWLLAGGVVALLYARWAFVVVGQLDQADDQKWGAYAIKNVPRHVANMFGLSFEQPWLPALGVLLAVFALVQSVRKGQGRIAFALLGLSLLPIVGAVAASSDKAVFVPRTLIGTTSSAHVLVALGIGYLITPAAAAITLALVGLEMPRVADYYAELRKEGWRDVVATIDRHWRRGALVVGAGGRESLQYAYYFQRKDQPYPARPFVGVVPTDAVEKTKQARALFVMFTDYRTEEAKPILRLLERENWARVRTFTERRVRIVFYRRPKAGAPEP